MYIIKYKACVGLLLKYLRQIAEEYRWINIETLEQKNVTIKIICTLHLIYNFYHCYGLRITCEFAKDDL